MPKYFLLVFILTTFFACNLAQDETLLAQQEEFKQILKDDATFKIQDADYYKKEIAKFQALDQTLQDFEMDRLLPENQPILKQLQEETQEKLWRLETFKIQQWNPTQYNIVEQIQSVYMDTSNPKQTDNLIAILQQVPAYYEGAIQNIQQPTRFHTKLAIQQQEGTYSFFANEITELLNKIKPTPKVKSTLQFHQQKSLLAVKDFLGFLNSCINNADDGNESDVLNTLEEKRKIFLEYYAIQHDSIDWVNFEIHTTQ